MKPTYSRPIIWICSLIMTALGFAGCSNDEDTIVADEYGTPYADYKYMGTVTDENGKPIEGINVVIQKHGYKNYPELFRIESCCKRFLSRFSGKSKSNVRPKTKSPDKINLSGDLLFIGGVFQNIVRKLTCFVLYIFSLGFCLNKFRPKVLV